MAVTGGELLLELFKVCGIEHIFCSPGTEWAPVWEGLLKLREPGDKTFKYINCRDEILAVSMAQGYAEVTGRLPAVLLHASVGPLHGAMAMRNAYAARVPMIIFSGETCEHCGDEEVRAQGGHWLELLSDIGGPAALVKNYVKWANDVSSRDTLVDSVIRGSRIAMAAPRGPVFVSIPVEVLQKSRAGLDTLPPYPATAAAEPRSSDIREVARQLTGSRQPIIIAEHAGKHPGAVTRLTELAELLSVPVFESSLPYTSNFPKNHPLYQGSNVAEALQQADTVFVVSGTTPWYPPGAGPGKGAKIIMLDEAPLHERLPYWGYRIDMSIAADIEPALAALVSAVRAEIKGQKPSPDYRERLAHWREKHDSLMVQLEKEALAVKGNKPIATRWFLQVAKQTLPANAIILDETILHTRLIHQVLAEPGGYIKSAYGGLGVGLGESLGVKLANPDRPVVIMVGDGAFNYNPALAALGLGQEYGLPVFIIIFNNGGYQAMKFGHRLMYPQGAAASRDTYLGVDITPAPDYVKLAGAFGAYGERLEEPGEIAAALKRGLQQTAKGNTALLDLVLDRSFSMLPVRRPG